MKLTMDSELLEQLDITEEELEVRPSIAQTVDDLLYPFYEIYNTSVGSRSIPPGMFEDITNLVSMTAMTKETPKLVKDLFDPNGTKEEAIDRLDNLLGETKKYVMLLVMSNFMDKETVGVVRGTREDYERMKDELEEENTPEILH